MEGERGIKMRLGKKKGYIIRENNYEMCKVCGFLFKRN